MVKSSSCTRFDEEEDIHISKRFRLNNDEEHADWKINAVLAPDCMATTTSRKAIGLSVKDKKKISTIVKRLDKFFPLRDLTRAPSGARNPFHNLFYLICLNIFVT